MSPSTWYNKATPSGTSGGPLSLYLRGPTQIPGGFVMPKVILTTQERFWAKVKKTETCWLWTGVISHGYGRFWVQGHLLLAHRFVYELLVGQIPVSLTLDHLCRVRHCVNPKHLEPVTNRENILRGDGHTAVHARQTHCIHGHPFNLANTYITRAGARECRECKRGRDRLHSRSRLTEGFTWHLV